MSGIAGVVTDDGGILDPGIAARLIAAAPVRGFDGSTFWHGGPACLIRHHHATTPEAVGETQPLLGPGGVVMVLDGRLDNRADLIAFLARDDCGQAATDVALALALFERLGKDCVHRLVGDWALAVWHAGERSLFLARAPMGWRPLLWSRRGGLFAFSTEPRALLKGLGLDHRVNERVIGEYLALRMLTRTETLWQAVEQLEQGCAMRVSRGTVRRWRWHDPSQPIDERLSDIDHIDRFNTLFDQAIIATSRSSTQVSAHLSGGLDSSSIVTRAIGLHRAGRIDRPIQAISARFPGLPHDETRWSKAVEHALGITARVTTTTPYSFEAARRWAAETYQLPVRPNAIETGLAALRLMEAEGGRVVLTGEGGDDWMANSVAYFADLLRQGKLGTLARVGWTQNPEYPPLKRLARTAFWSLAPHLSTQRRRQIALPQFADGSVEAWIDPRWAARVGLADRFADAMPGVTLMSNVQQQRYANYDLPGRYFIAANGQALAEQHGVEMRHPFHDLRLTGFFMTAAPRMMQRGQLRKRLLRDAMRGSLVESVRTRRDKASFSQAVAQAVTRRLEERPVEAMLPVALGWIDADAARTMADAVRADVDGRRFMSLIPLWNIISLDIWLAEAAAA